MQIGLSGRDRRWYRGEVGGGDEDEPGRGNDNRGTDVIEEEVDIELETGAG